MSTRSRAYTRAQNQRAKIKAREIARKQLFDPDEKDLVRQTNRLYKNRAACSCEMCRNPRRRKYCTGESKLTFQELKQNQKDKHNE